MARKRVQCPGCAAQGRDNSKNNLSLFPDDESRGWCMVCNKAYSVDGSESHTKPAPRNDAPSGLDLAAIQTLPFRALEDRGISKETCERFGVRAAVDEATATVVTDHYYPYYQNGEVVGYKRRRLPKQFAAIGKIKGLFGQHQCKGNAKFLLVTEGELDCLSAWELFVAKGKGYNVVSLPNGANEQGTIDAVTRKELEFFTSHEVVYICLDEDEPGQTTAKALAELLISQCKVKIMRLSRKDSNEYLKAGDVEGWWGCLRGAKDYEPEAIENGSVDDIGELLTATTPGVFVDSLPLTMQKLQGLRPGEITMILAPPGVGKCLGKGTPVLMYDGSIKAVEDVVVGDKLMGPDSTPRNVLSLGRGVDTLYRVTPNKGDSYVVNSEHILSLRKSGADGIVLSDGTHIKPRDDVVNVDVQTYLHSGEYAKSRLKGYRSREIQSFGRELKDIDVPPYIVGCYLGDGTAGSPCVSKPECEMTREWVSYGRSVGCTLSLVAPGDRCEQWRMVNAKGQTNPITEKMRRLGLDKQRFIPDEYKYGSLETRREVLAGLIDSDGHIFHGSCDWITKHKQLADDFAFVCRSLGLSCYLSYVKKTISSTGFEGMYWRASVSGRLCDLPMRDKKAPERKINKDNLVHGITVEKIGKGDYFGFEIDGDRLFLLGDFTVTHNTTLCRQITYDLLTKQPHPVFNIFLEEGKTKTRQGMVALHTGVALNHLRRDPSKVRREDVQHVNDNILNRLELLTNNKVLLNDEALLNKINYFVKAKGCRFGVLDHISYVMSSRDTKDERKEIDQLMTKLATLVEDQGLHLIIVSHIKRKNRDRDKSGKETYPFWELLSLDDARGSGAFEQLAWNIIGIEREVVDPSSGNLPKTRTRILKNREEGTLGLGDMLSYNTVKGALEPIGAGY